MSPKDIQPDDAQQTYREGWADAATWRSGDRMNDLETLMWRSERHPQQSSTITTLMILDRAPDWQRLRDAHEWAASMLLPIRRKVVEPALPVGPPRWVEDPDFTLDYHLRRAHLPAPGGEAELLALTQRLALAPFDRRRPLWEATLIEGLEGDRAAYVLKVHHSLTDDQSLMRLVSLVQSPTRSHTPKDAPPPRSPVSEPNPYGLAVDEIGEQVRSAPGYAARLLAWQARRLVKPEEALTAGLRYAGSMRRTLLPSAPNSPLFVGRTGKDWRFGIMDCPLDDLRAAAQSVGASTKDAHIAALLGGLRRYHEHHDIDLDELPLATAVNLRKSDDPLGGNKFAGATFAAPLDIDDPAERIATVRGMVLSLRVEPAIGSFSVVAPLLNHAPSGLASLVMRSGATADVSTSSVAGVARESYLAGARVERVHGFGPLPGVAMMSTLTSHSGTACFGVNVDGSAVADVPFLMQCLREGLAEVLALAGTSTS